MNFDLVDLSDSNTCKRNIKNKFSNISGNMKTSQEFVQKCIE